jgi:hypothetical protein
MFNDVKVIGIAITEDELGKMSLGDLITKAIEAAQKELGINFFGDAVKKAPEDAAIMTTKDKVYDTAMDLIDENGETTTLDIKNAMRECGEWITQREVSDCMQEFYDEGEFDYKIEDNHRVYFVSDGEEECCEDDGSCCCTDNSCNTNKTPAKIKTNDEEYIIEDGEEEDGDWEVYYMGDIVYVDSGVTRSKARVIGSHVFDVDYDDVRACRYHEE